MKYRKQITALILSFLLGTHNGYIALWKDGVQKPVKVFPYKVEMLPDVDRKALEKGIHIHSDSKLAEFLEDYLS